MNRTTFIKETTRLIQKALKFNEKVKKHGITSLEEEIEDLDDEDFKTGLRMLVDGVNPGIIDEVLSNKLSFEKDKYMRIYRTIAKRTVQGMQEGLNSRTLFYVLLSLAGLSPKEQREMERIVVSALYDSQSESSEDENGDAEELIIDGLDKEAVEEMLLRTSTIYAPWTVVEADNKEYARIKVL